MEPANKTGPIHADSFSGDNPLAKDDRVHIAAACVIDLQCDFRVYLRAIEPSQSEAECRISLGDPGPAG